MKRAYYFWIAAILALLFGLLMLFAPAAAAGAFKLAASDGSTATIFRVLGSVMLGVALLNFLVRNHPMSETLKAVLWGNVAIHGIGFIGDCWSAGIGDVPWSGIGAGLVAHLIVLIGAAYYLWRPSAP
jgi:hypothetical protein